jgi:hypothetical protein
MSFASAFCEHYLRRHEPGRCWSVYHNALGHLTVEVEGLPAHVVDTHEGVSWYMNREQHARELERKLELYLTDEGAWRPWSLL